jgi:putative membrane protein
MPFEEPSSENAPKVMVESLPAFQDSTTSASEPPHVMSQPLGLQRLHPTSFMFEVVSQIRGNLIPAAFALFFAAKDGGIWFAIAAFATVVTLIYSLIRYFTLRFKIQGEDLVVDEGIIFRRHRTVPLHRIQNIDIVQNILHRIFRVAEVRVETASGSEPEATLRVLAMSQIDALRQAVFNRSIADLPVSANNSSEAVGANSMIDATSSGTEQLIIDIPTKRLILAGLLSDRGLVVVSVIAGLLFQPDFRGRVSFDADEWIERIPDGLSWVAWTVIGIVGFIMFALLLKVFSAAWYILRFHGFQMERRNDDIRIRCGLFTKVAATIPRRRIQLISIHRTWLGRYFGLASIRVETAGGAGGDSDNAAATVGRKWFLPALPESEVPRILSEIRPGLNWKESDLDWKPLSPKASRRMMRFAIIFCVVIAAVGAFIWRPWGVAFGLALLPVSIWFARKKAKATRYARNNDLIAFRSGLMTRKLSITFFDKVQTAHLSQSPFDRRWKMATLVIDTAGVGPADHVIAVEMLDADFAANEHQAVVERAAQAMWQLS